MQGGYSGAPVFNAETKAVIGIIAVYDNTEGALAVPLQIVSEKWSSLNSFMHPQPSVPVVEKSDRPAKVFISYRSQDPDLSLAQDFYEGLKAAGHQPFMAGESIGWGENWPQRVDAELEQCDYFLLLLSPKSISSEMVIEEVRRARELRDKNPARKPIILPIRVNLSFDAPLNYDLRSYLQRIQQKNWSSAADTPVILQEILELLSTGLAPAAVEPEPTKVFATETLDCPPLPVAELELPGGQMQLSSRFYIKREPDESRCYQEIERTAGLIRIKAPRQMGKTSLLARISHHAQTKNYRTVSLSFQETDETVFQDLDKFLRRFCALVSRELGIPPKTVNEYWEDDLFGPKDNCNEYFGKVLLADLTTPLVLGLDEVDRIFPYNNVANEFLSLLRAWNEKAKINDTWQKLRMVIVHSTESYVVMDVNSSPFNVGLPIDLEEFSPAQVQDLAQRHGLSWGNGDIDKLMGILGGHPYLVRLALYNIAQRDISLNQLVETASTDAGIYGDHLRRHLWNLQQHPELMTAFKQVVMTRQPVRLDPMLAFKLNGMGLVELQGNDVTLRYEKLYRQYFRDRLRIG